MAKLGGKRPGAGRKKGTKSKKTIEQQIVLDALRERIMKNSQRILDSQMSLAQGQQFLYRIETYKNGSKSKPELITDENTIQKYLDGEFGDGESIDDDKEYYFITTKEPNNQAIDSMYNRVFGKPIDSLEVSGKNGADLSIKVINYARNNNPPQL